MRILLVEDDREVAEYVGRGLEEEGNKITFCYDGGAALRAAESARFDIIVLDVMLPFLDGLEVTRRLRAAANDTPILLLTARDSAQDIVKGLDAGADDYLTKPFSFGVLLARLRARTRAGAAASRLILRAAGLAMNLETHEVWRGPQGIALTRTERDPRMLDEVGRTRGNAPALDRDGLGAPARRRQQQSGRVHPLPARQDRRSRTTKHHPHRARCRVHLARRGSVMGFVSIRLRLAAWYFITVALVLCLFGVGAWAAMRHSVLQAVDRDLNVRLRDVREFVDLQLRIGPKELLEELSEEAMLGLGGGLFQLLDEHDQVLYRSKRLGNAQFPRTEGNVTRASGKSSLRMASQTVWLQNRRFTIQVAESMEEFDESSKSFRSLLLILSPLFLLLASLGEHPRASSRRPHHAGRTLDRDRQSSRPAASATRARRTAPSNRDAERDAGSPGCGGAENGPVHGGCFA
jgi:CheY-like chemotaxis protein